jgi:MerR family transcriptional regulator, light-induced transcriptional regulator
MGEHCEAHTKRIDDLRRAYAAALLSGDEPAAEAVMREAVQENLATAEIDHEIVAPALWLVGDLWQRGEITVADEHLATEISLRVLALQREAQRTSRERPLYSVMLATPAGEAHDVALRMVENLLRGAGYGVVMLGAGVPAHELAGCAARYRPDAVCLSATMPGGADQVLVAIHEMQRAWPSAGYVAGGADLGGRLRPRPGIDVCEDVMRVVDAVDAIVKRSALN